MGWRAGVTLTLEIVVHKIKGYVLLPSRREWGECWWTARDICITNEPNPFAGTHFEQIVDTIERDLQRKFLFGV